MPNGLAIDRCPLHEDCFRVVKYGIYDIKTRQHPEVATHLCYLDALSIVTSISPGELLRIGERFDVEWLKNQQRNQT